MRSATTTSCGMSGRRSTPPRRSTTSTASGMAACGSPTRRSPRSATCPGVTCSTFSATSASTRCPGPGSGRGSPAPTSAALPSISPARWPTARLPRARFVRSDLYDLPAVLDGDFDIVYTSRGALNWLPDIRRWAARRGPLRPARRHVLHHRAPPGGQRVRERGRRARRAAPRLPVLGARRAAALRRSPARTRTRRPRLRPRSEHGWDHGLGEIVTALIEAGLRIESLREFPFAEWRSTFSSRAPTDDCGCRGDARRAAAVLLAAGHEAARAERRSRVRTASGRGRTGHVSDQLGGHLPDGPVGKGDDWWGPERPRHPLYRCQHSGFLERRTCPWSPWLTIHPRHGQSRRTLRRRAIRSGSFGCACT